MRHSGSAAKGRTRDRKRATGSVNRRVLPFQHGGGSQRPLPPRLDQLQGVLPPFVVFRRLDELPDFSQVKNVSKTPAVGLFRCHGTVPFQMPVQGTAGK